MFLSLILARGAFAALGGAVPGVAFHDQSPVILNAGGVHKQSSSVSGRPAAVENVSIINSATYPEDRCFFVNEVIAELPIGIRMEESRESFLAGGKIDHSFHLSTIQSKISFAGWHGDENAGFVGLQIGNKAFKGIGNLAGGSLTEIFGDYLDLHVFSRLHSQHLHIFNMDVGPQFAVRAAPHDGDGGKKSGKLQESDKDRNSGDFVAQSPTDEPSIAPLLWSLGAGGVGFILCLWGLFNWDERRLFGSVLFGLGLMLVCGGLLIWWPRW